MWVFRFIALTLWGFVSGHTNVTTPCKRNEAAKKISAPLIKDVIQLETAPLKFLS